MLPREEQLAKGDRKGKGPVSAKTKTKHNRSRGGCTRCRLRRQKCEEQKPKCRRCELDGVEKCVYEVTLQWGGRSFQHYSRNEDIKKLETEPGTFVYVSSSAPRTSRLSSSSQESTAMSASLGRSFSPLETTTPMERMLLHHFTHEASKTTACHPHIHREICKLLLPMALDYPPLLNALTALSAIHRNSLYAPLCLTSSSPTSLPVPISELESNTITSLKALCVSQLRHQLLLPKMRDAVLATVLALCMCEIHSGGDQPRSWRLHLEGAKAIISTYPAISGSTTLVGSSQNGLLGRWYTSIEALAAISDRGLKAGQLPAISSANLFKNGSTGELSLDKEVYLDDYFGFVTDLVEKFFEIGTLASKHQSLSSKTSDNAFSHVSLSESDIELEACALEAAVQDMILRDNTHQPKFYPGVREQLNEDVVEEFMLCNEAYQHTALLHIYGRILCLSPNHIKVRASVQRILQCVKQIQPRGGLSPYIVLNVPLFTAGKAASTEQREQVREATRQLAQMSGLRNVWKGVEILEKQWEREDSGRSEAPDIEDLDFIPY